MSQPSAGSPSVLNGLQKLSDLRLSGLNGVLSNRCRRDIIALEIDIRLVHYISIETAMSNFNRGFWVRSHCNYSSALWS